MGMGFPFGSARRSGNPAPGDPNPTSFRIIRTEQIGLWTIAEIVYPDALNYEGRKLALYLTSAAVLRAARKLDPHFSDASGPLVPVARFEPTARGLLLARCAAQALGAALPPYKDPYR